jgi:hypothetical protein
VLEWRDAEMLIHFMKTVEQASEVIRASLRLLDSVGFVGLLSSAGIIAPIPINPHHRTHQTNFREKQKTQIGPAIRGEFLGVVRFRFIARSVSTRDPLLGRNLH